MPLRTKILIGYGIALTLTALVVAWAIVNLVFLGDASDAILRENYKSILAAENMIDSIERQDSATLLVMLDYTDEGLVQFRQNENHFLQWLGRANDNITIDGEREILRSIEDGYSVYLINFSKLLDIWSGSSDRPSEFYHETLLPSFKKVRDDAVRLREINQETMFEASSRARLFANNAIWSTAAVAAAALGVGLGFSLLLSKRIVQPILSVIGAAAALAEGDYSVEVPASGSDELASLAGTFNAMARKLGVYHRLNVERVIAEKHKSDAVLRSIEDGVIVVDPQFRIVNMNPQAGRALGVDSEAVCERHFLEIVKSDHLFALIKQTADSGNPPDIEEGEDILTVEEGRSPRHYMCGITPVLSKGGGMLGVVVLLRDVTRLRELDRLKSEFVMTASHELKTPIQSLGMSIALLQESALDKLDPKQIELLDAAGEELARLKSLVSDLLDLSKIEAGNVGIEIEEIAPTILVDKAMEVFQTQAREKGLELRSEIPPNLPEVRADPNKITWVLTNLIVNALRYAQRSISVSVHRMGDWIHFSVADDGEGIPPEYQSRIFDKFVQVKNERSVGGTGLGLAICKEVIRAHKGTIWVDSTVGEGSTFTFVLPVASRHKETGNGDETRPHRGR